MTDIKKYNLFSLTPAVYILVFLTTSLTSSCIANPSDANRSESETSSQAHIPELPLLSINDLSYQGAFRMGTKKKDGHADSVYASAVFELSADGNSFFFGGRKINTIIGEFALPDLSTSYNVKDLNIASVIQDYTSILGRRSTKYKTKRIATGNIQKLDRITGLMLHDNKLIINASRYYDAPAKTKHTTVVLEDINDLANSRLRGPYSLKGAAHASGWLSEIPPEWQHLLDADTIAGWASNFPIARRNSIGPSAFGLRVKDLLDIDTDTADINTKAFADYSLKSPLHIDIYNNNNTVKRVNKNQSRIPVIVGNNNLWTVVSWATYGFIIPNTRTYAVFGSSGGHNSGLGYKILQDGNTRNCPGPCAVDPNDYYNYYWLYDVEDLVAVKSGKKLAHEIRPYDYGIFPAPFQPEYSPTSNPKMIIRPIRGGDFDHRTDTLYLVLGGSLQEQQIIIAYSINEKITRDE